MMHREQGEERMQAWSRGTTCAQARGGECQVYSGTENGSMQVAYGSMSWAVTAYFHQRVRLASLSSWGLLMASEEGMTWADLHCAGERPWKDDFWVVTEVPHPSELPWGCSAGPLLPKVQLFSVMRMCLLQQLDTPMKMRSIMLSSAKEHSDSREGRKLALGTRCARPVMLIQMLASEL